MKVTGASFNVDNTGIKVSEAKEEAKTYSDEIQKSLDESIFRGKDNVKVTYGYLPSSGMKIGDVAWRFNGSDFTDGNAYRYDGYNWRPVKESSQNIYGSQIYGADIHGASISGGIFKSEGTNPNNGLPNFFVSTNGQIYATNYYMDISTSSSGMNGRNYSGAYSPNEADRSGFNLDRGVMQMHAYATQNTGTVAGDERTFWGHTYLEPDYLKFRNSSTKTVSGNSLRYRTDIRSGLISIGTEYNETIGTKISDTDIQIKKPDTFSTSNIGSSFSSDILSLNNSSMVLNAQNYNFQVDNRALYFTRKNGTTLDINFGYGYSNIEVQTPTIATSRIRHPTYGDVQYGGLTGSTIYVRNLNQGSNLSIKKDVESLDKNEILSKVLATDIKGYRYKTQNNNEEKSIGPIIDNVNDNKQYYVPKEILNKSEEKDSDSIALDNAVSFSFAAIQELSKQKNDLELRVAQLERKLNQL